MRLLKKLILLACTCMLALMSAHAEVRSPVRSPVRPPTRSLIALPKYWSMAFDGGDYATMSNAVSAGHFSPGTGSFSMAAWVKVGVYGDNDMICQKRTFTPKAPGFMFKVYSNRRIRFDLGDGTNEYSAQTPLSSMPVAGTWAHVGVVVDRTAATMQLYINGSASGSSVSIPLLTGSLNNTEEVAFGVGNGRAAEFFTGSIATFDIWIGTALSASQMAAEYSRTTPYIHTVTPTWGTAFQPGSGNTINPYVGTSTAVFTNGTAPANGTWGGPYTAIPPNN